ncbi:LIC_12616 family protein [Silvanigrella sp.]|jgi:hypothetical protein|uniref:phage neck terminator protein n=1 Tax=Silvanigrella sp. TaxID=2024976 RepID=UPI0037CB8A51
MIIIKQMRDIQKILSKYLDTKYVVYSEQEFKKPLNDYSCMKLLSYEPVGFSEKVNQDNQYIYKKQRMNMVLQFDCLGQNASEMAIKLINLKSNSDIRNELINLNISWLKNSAIINTTELNETESIKPRLTFEAYFKTIEEIKEKIYFIKKVEINGKS